MRDLAVSYVFCKVTSECREIQARSSWQAFLHLQATRKKRKMRGYPAATGRGSPSSLLQLGHSANECVEMATRVTTMALSRAVFACVASTILVA